MAENVPRRMQRFYRTGEQKPNNEQESYGKVSEDPLAQEKTSPNGRAILGTLPSMGYEDLPSIDQRNFEELKKIHQKNMEEKLALSEVEKFKQEKNRLPTKEESEQIAENLYTQLKNNPTETGFGLAQVGAKLPPASKNSFEDINLSPPEGGERLSRREQRRAGRRGENEQQKSAQTKPSGRQAQSSQPQIAQVSPIADIKALLGDEGLEGSSKKEKKRSDFDLGLDSDLDGEAEEEINDDVNSIDDLLPTGSNACPNCKKTAEKIIYCPKCGTAFCSSCAKKQESDLFCPKCGEKIKA